VLRHEKSHSENNTESLQWLQKATLTNEDFRFRSRDSFH
jgi:hypothetical protein